MIDTPCKFKRFINLEVYGMNKTCYSNNDVYYKKQPLAVVCIVTSQSNTYLRKIVTFLYP